MPPSADIYQQVQSFKPRTTDQLTQQAEEKYGTGEVRGRLSNLRSLVGNLQSAVEAVDPSVTGRTSGTFTTEGQRQALVNKERAPILGDLSKQQSALGQTQAELDTSQSLASRMVEALMQEDQTSYQRLLDQYNAAAARERADEEKRQFEENLRLQREQMVAQERAAQRASKGVGGYQLSSPSQPAPNTPKSGQQFIGNDDFRGRLAYAASKGNNDAKIALKYAGNDARYNGYVESMAELDALKRLGIQGNYRVRTTGSSIRLR